MSLAFFTSQSLIFIIPLLIVAIGGMYAEKSGTINIALEGMMVLGAVFGIIFINKMQAANILSNSPQLLLLLALIVAGIFGSLTSALLGFLAIKMKADQTIGGTAINLLAAALALYILKAVVNDTRVYFDQVFELKSTFLSGIPFLNTVLFHNAFITSYVGVAILIITVIIFKYTRFGLRLAAAGEFPQAAQAAGIKVIKYRWIGVLISGFLAGVGGLTYAVTTSTSFEGNVSGYGFLAIAVLIFGQWKASKVLYAAIFFGLFKAFSVQFFAIDFIFNFITNNPNIPITMLFRMSPYIATMVILAITSKKSRAPKASGIPFDPLSS